MAMNRLHLPLPSNSIPLAPVHSHSSTQIEWQVLVGALAGITPFIVAGIEFGKRIAIQKKCEICKGTGLIKREQYYFRCYACGGFLPWQSWKRFFSG